MVEDLGAELSLGPLLERILARSIDLLGGDAGSICLVNEARGAYRKEADIGVACQSGQEFPLSEGVTGAIVAGPRLGRVRRLRGRAGRPRPRRPSAPRCAA